MIKIDKKLKRTERGWAGHFIAAEHCLFRRNTLLEYNEIKIVVSTVGLMLVQNKLMMIGVDRHYETMAFHSKHKDKRFHDADVSKEIKFISNWIISHEDADDKANMMHEKVVDEITKKLIKGRKFKNT